jgi:hypothetical protein
MGKKLQHFCVLEAEGGFENKSFYWLLVKRCKI